MTEGRALDLALPLSTLWGGPIDVPGPDPPPGRRHGGYPMGVMANHAS